MNFTAVYKVNINDISRSEFGAAYFLMSEERQKKCDSLKREEDKRLCIAADMLLRQSLFEYAGIKKQELMLSFSENGKPYIEDGRVHFSVSHSGDIAVVCINEKNPVGIDIEKITQINSRVAKRIFSDAEISFVFSSAEIPSGLITDRQVLERFFRVWTYKEAFVKMTGEGITDDIINVPYKPEKCCCEIFDDYCITVVTKE